VERPTISASITRGDDSGVCLAHEQVGTSPEQLVHLLAGFLQGSGHLLAVVSPRIGELGWFAETGEARQRTDMFHVHRAALAQMTADVRGGSRNEVFNGEHREPSRLFVQRVGSRQRRSESPEEIQAKAALPIDELEQRPTFGRVGMNVVRQEPIGKRPRDRVEALDHEVEVVQRTRTDRATVRA
jgi:hypothetical protein